MTNQLIAVLSQHDELFRLITENVTDMIAVVDRDGRRVYNNLSYRTLNSDVEQLSGTDSFAEIHPEDRERVRQAFAATVQSGQGQRAHFRFLLSDGHVRHIESQSSVIRDTDGIVSQVIIVSRDITERTLAERKIIRLGNLYSTLSQTNQAIVRIDDAQTLFEEVCRVAVQHAHFEFAWIGLIDQRSQTLQCAAMYGAGGDFLDTLPWLLAPAHPKGRGPATTAARENRPYVCNDIVADPNTRPWREAVSRACFRSTASFPVRRGGQAIGVLSLYSDEVNYFDGELTQLLEGMANDISFALGNFDRELRRSLAETAVAASEARYRQLVELSPEATFVHRSGRFMLANAACARVLGVAQGADLTGRRVLDFIHPDDRELVKGRALPFHEKDTSVPFIEEKWLRADGTSFDAEVAAAAYSLEGQPAVQVVLRDITERKQMEGLLRKLAEATVLMTSEGFFPALTHHLAEAVGARFAVVAECLDQRQERARVLAFWKDGEWLPSYEYELNNTPCQTLLDTNALCHFPDNVQAHFPGNERLPALNIAAYMGVPLQTAAKKTIGHMFVMHDKPLPNDERAKYVMNIFAARAAAELERKRAEEDMRHMAHHDALTGLPNRVLLQDRLIQAVGQAHRYGEQVAVLFLDLDRFKNINDTLGHEAGDRALQDIAQRLRACLRESDTIGRVGGDEFMVLIDDFSDHRYVGEIAQKILDTVSQAFVLDTQECHVTASIGIATYPIDGQTAQQLLKNADIAMYRAKGIGKNNYQFYSAQMNVHTVERLALESGLRRAIEMGELEVHYQPKISLATRLITGMEVLVRWRHSERGLLSPDEFIPIAEETGLITLLGAWVLKTACVQARAWRDQGLPVMRLAVNLSARQFTHKNLVSDIRSALALSRFDPRDLELEITESMVMHTPENAVKVMTDLKALGIHLAIDDFGTGYSSLAYLKRFPIDSLKIDRSFIKDIPHDRDDAAITQAVIAMARSMDMRVVAEGVETIEQVNFLATHGCDECQGFYFSRPLVAEAFEALLREQTEAVAVA